MKKAIQTTHQLNASADAIWNTIKSGNKWEDWFPILTGSQTREGNRRVCKLDGGGEIYETVLSQNSQKTFMYAVEDNEFFPVKDTVAIMRVEDNGDNTSTLTWDVEFNAPKEVYVEMNKQISGLYEAGAQKLAEISKN